MEDFTLLRFHTAATLGMPVRELDTRMTGAELLQWGKYFEHLNGGGEQQEDLTGDAVLQQFGGMLA